MEYGCGWVVRINGRRERTGRRDNSEGVDLETETIEMGVML